MTVVVLAAVLLLHVVGEDVLGRWIATVCVAAYVVWTLVGMVRDVMRGHVGLDILAVVAMVATLAVGEYLASLIIVLMLSGGEALVIDPAWDGERLARTFLDAHPDVRIAGIVCTHAQTPEQILAPKTVGSAELARCAELGEGLAAGLAAGVF